MAVGGESVTYALPTPPPDRRMISTRAGDFLRVLALREARARRCPTLFSVYFHAPEDKSVEKRNTPRIKFHS